MKRARLLLIFATFALAFASWSQAAEEPDADPLANFDQTLSRFKRDIWNVQRLTSMFGKDFRGRMLNDDLRDFVLSKATETELQRQRSVVEKQIRNGRVNASDAVSVLNKIVTEENTRLEIIFMHRLQFRQLARQRDLWRVSSERAPNYKVPQKIERLENEAVAKLNSGDFAAVTYAIYPELQRAYAEERAELFKYQRAAGIDAAHYSRRTPCGEPAKSTGKEVPALASKTAPQYPPESKRAREEGIVLIDVLVSATGCATDFTILSSSGWLALDDAALDWLEAASFTPAEKNGRPAAVSVSVPVNFKID